MNLLTGEAVGIVLTVLVLALTFAATLAIELNWRTRRVRAKAVGVVAGVLIVWVVLVALRFVFDG